ncbi:Dps family protein [Yunchengibacter salinarum]|uniref:Dps family protein n=1 Tax=Yunchengibacter salinarum TaxID=3133399 RepID=UPI0035B606BF
MNKQALANDLKGVLAESVQLYVLTWNVHWNVTGPLFNSVHTLTEEQYTELATAVDDIAERIRALGEKAPAGLKVFQDMGDIADGDERASAEDMVRALAAAQEKIGNRIRPLISKSSEDGDEVTAGLLTDRLTVHEKSAWMLRSIVGEN